MRFVKLGHDAATGGAGPTDPADAGDRAEAGARDAAGGSGSISSADAATKAAHDAGPGSMNDAGAPGDQRADASSEAGSACAPPSPSPAVCDPVNDTGCGSGMQCDVDLLQSELAGLCAFSTQYDAGPCTATGLSESCPVKQTCVLGTCRKLCYCDSDCAPGECCTERLDDTLGWMLCAPCP